MRNRHKEHTAQAASAAPNGQNILGALHVELPPLPEQPIDMDASDVCLFAPGYKFVRVLWMSGETQLV